MKNNNEHNKIVNEIRDTYYPGHEVVNINGYKKFFSSIMFNLVFSYLFSVGIIQIIDNIYKFIKGL